MSVKNIDNHQGHEKCLKIMKQKQNEFKKVKAQLEQKIQLIQQQFKDYQERTKANTKLNQSIMSTYQQQQNIRQEHVNRQINILNSKHQNQIKKLKQIHQKQMKQYQENLTQFKNKYEQVAIQIDKKTVQFDIRVLELKKKFEIQLKRQIEQKQKQMETKIQILNQKLKQSEGTAEIYKQFVQQRREIYGDEDFRPSNLKLKRQRQSHGYRQSRQQSQRKTTNFQIQNQNEYGERLSRQSRINDIKQNNIEDRKRLSRSKQSVKQLTMKIDRALTQLRGSNASKLHQRINQKLSKRLR